MSYELPDIELYEWGPDATFGATTVTHQITGPKGKVGFVRDILVDVATALVGTTSVPEVQVGIASGDYTFGRYRLGTTATTGYGTGLHRASDEAIVGNPPRVLSDFAGHVVLDGGPLGNAGTPGGTYLTVVPTGRIPASGKVVTNVVSGTGGVCRVYFDPKTSVSDLTVGQTVNFVQAPQGSTGISVGTNYTISAISSVNNYIELTGTTFGGTYTGGGIMNIVVFVTLQAGVGGTPAGGGYARVKIQWIGAATP